MNLEENKLMTHEMFTSLLTLHDRKDVLMRILNL
jgi:hypothetical protein